MSAPFAAEVATYLADCATHARLLNPAHHPTEDGALKLIWHRGPDQAGQIREAFRAAAGKPAPTARPRRRPAREAGLSPAEIA